MSACVSRRPLQRTEPTPYSYTLNVWDVGGQRTLRPYWRNYFEQTDAIVWVVDSSDRLRLEDCRLELHSLLLEDRLAGASLLVFVNKQDIPGSLTQDEIRDVRPPSPFSSTARPHSRCTGTRPPRHQIA